MDGSRSRENLLSFLDYCKDKGMMGPATAEARKAAVNQVLSILKDEEARDVSTLDLDLLLRRFQNQRIRPAGKKPVRIHAIPRWNQQIDFVRVRQKRSHRFRIARHVKK